VSREVHWDEVRKYFRVDDPYCRELFERVVDVLEDIAKVVNQLREKGISPDSPMADIVDLYAMGRLSREDAVEAFRLYTELRMLRRLLMSRLRRHFAEACVVRT